MLTSVFFDLDQTLVDRTATFKAYLVKQHEELEVAAAGVSLKHYCDQVYKWDDNGYRDKYDTFSRALKGLQLNLDVDAFMHHFKHNYGQDACLFTGVKPMLAKLSQQYSLALVSNGRTQGQSVKLEVTGIAEYFDQVIISEREGVKKPDPKIYELACERMGVPPEQVMFVGDHPKNDVEVPMSLGMRAIWVRTENYHAPDQSSAIVQSVLEVPALL